MSTSVNLSIDQRHRLRAAFHEAGHAVAVVLSGGRVDKAELREDPDTRGSCSYSDLPTSAEPVVTYAGPWCEARWRFGARPQLRDIREVIAANRSDADELSLTADAGLPRAIERDLETCWPAIGALAAALYATERSRTRT